MTTTPPPPTTMATTSNGSNDDDDALSRCVKDLERATLLVVKATAVLKSIDLTQSLSSSSNEKQAPAPPHTVVEQQQQQPLAQLGVQMSFEFDACMRQQHPQVAAVIDDAECVDRVALCGGSVARFVRHFANALDVDDQLKSMTYDLDLFVYGATHDERVSTFRRVVCQLVRSTHAAATTDAAKRSPVYVVAQRGVWTLTCATWSRPVQVMLTEHTTLANVLNAFDIDASRLAWIHGTRVVTIDSTEQLATIHHGMMRNVNPFVSPTRLVKYVGMGWLLTEAIVAQSHEIIAALKYASSTTWWNICNRDAGAPRVYRAIDDVVLHLLPHVRPSASVPCGDQLLDLDHKAVLTTLRDTYPSASSIGVACVWGPLPAAVGTAGRVYRSRSRPDQKTVRASTPYGAVFQSMAKTCANGGAAAALEMAMMEGGQISSSGVDVPDDDDSGAAASTSPTSGAAAARPQIRNYRSMRLDQSMAALFVNLEITGGVAVAPKRLLTSKTVHYDNKWSNHAFEPWRAPLMRIGEALVINVRTTSNKVTCITVQFSDGSRANAQHEQRRAEWQRAAEPWLRAKGVTPSIIYTTTTTTPYHTVVLDIEFSSLKAVVIGTWVSVTYYVHHLWLDYEKISWHEEIRGVGVKALPSSA